VNASANTRSDNLTPANDVVEYLLNFFGWHILFLPDAEVE
jgi:hypothetical protein